MRINIYLTPLEKKELSRLKNQHHLSFSTICNIVARNTAIVTKKLYDNEYIYTEKGMKTSIKPKKEPYLDEITNLSKYYSNTIKKYLRHDYKDLEEKTKTKLLNKILNEMKETYDPNWDGNEWNRKLPRLLRQNPEYYRRILEKC